MFAVAVVVSFGAAGAARAADWPSNPIRVIVPYSAGSAADIVPRIVFEQVKEQIGQTIIVENKPGASGTIGARLAAQATPDGYTLLLHNLQISANVTLYKNLPFDTEKDLVPVIFVNRNPLVLVGRRDLDANDLDQFLALMKKSTLKAAIPGYGATGHLATALLAQEAGAKIDMIPYRGAAPALNDIIGSHVDVFFATPQSIIQQVNSHNMKAYGVTSKAKLPELPNVKSFVDKFGEKLDISFWQAVFAPAGTPKVVVEKLNAAMQKTLSDPAIVKSWADQSVEVYPASERSTAAAAKMMKSEVERWGKVIKDNNIHLDQ